MERKLAVIGEALARLRKDYRALLQRISDTQKIIGFRNMLIHGYAIIDNATVWSAIQRNLPTLLEEVKTLHNA